MTIKDPAPNQHYRLSLEKAKRDYQDGILTATGLVYYTIGIYRAPGQRLRVRDIDEFCRHIGINRATFYRAISKLKAKGRLEWEAIGGIEVWIPTSNVVELQTGQDVSQTCESLSQFDETESQTCESLSQFGEIESQTCKNLSQLSDSNRQKAPKPADSSPPSNRSHIDSIDPNFLSEPRERETENWLNKIPEVDREKFRAFARSKAAQLPDPPQLVEKWIADNVDWIKPEFDKAYPQEALPTGQDESSVAVPKSKNPMGWDLPYLKRLYPDTWREAAAHFGFEVDVAVSLGDVKRRVTPKESPSQFLEGDTLPESLRERCPTQLAGQEAESAVLGSPQVEQFFKTEEGEF